MFGNLKISVCYSFIGLLLWTFLIVLIPFSSSSVNAQEVGKYGKQLDEAEQKYNTGGFDQAIEILTNILKDTDLTSEEQKRTYRLLGLTYIAKEFEVEAKNAVTKLLEIVPDYQADPEQDPPGFIKLVEEHRSAAPEEEESSFSWLWIAGGAAVAGGVAAVLLLKSSGDDEEATNGGDFPSPPGRPN